MNPEDIDQRFSAVLTLIDKYPVAAALVIIVVLDIICGTAVAVSTKTVCSTISFRGMCRKGVELIIVMAAMVLEPFIKLDDGVHFPLGKLVAIFFLYSETISILEKAALLGVPIPPVLLEVLLKLRSSARPVESQQVNVVNEIHTGGPVVLRGPAEQRVTSDPKSQQPEQ